jgi:hypothetical protein
LRDLETSEELIITFCWAHLCKNIGLIRCCADLLDKLYSHLIIRTNEKQEFINRNFQKEEENKNIGLDIEAINKLFTFGGEQGMLLDYDKLVEDHIFELAANLVTKMDKKKKGKIHIRGNLF